MFHATAMSADYDSLFTTLETAFGCRLLHEESSTEPAIARRGALARIGDASIELGAPLGENSPVQRFLDRFGGGLHSIAVQIDDLDAALASAEEQGVRLAVRLGPDAAFTAPADTGGLLVQWSSVRVEDDPHWGGSDPPLKLAPLVDVTRLAFVGALVREPEKLAARLASLFETDSTFLDADSPGEPRATVSVGDCLVALYALPGAGEDVEWWGASYSAPRFHCLGLEVTDVPGAVRALRSVDLAHAVTNPVGHALCSGTPLPFPVVLTDVLLPGDPRR
jgi:methylmalonyl-CoA/ethylmalonyl-CoA epimerase